MRSEETSSATVFLDQSDTNRELEKTMRYIVEMEDGTRTKVVANNFHDILRAFPDGEKYFDDLSDIFE